MQRRADYGHFESGLRRCACFRAVLGAWAEERQFYKWRARFGGMDVSMVSQMKDMIEQNRRLKRMYAL